MVHNHLPNMATVRRVAQQTSKRAEIERPPVITRLRDLLDDATPSGNAMAVITLLKLAGFTNELRTIDIAHQALAQIQSMMSLYPLGFAHWIQALTYALSKPREIAIVVDPETADTKPC